ncbi:MAG TPA: RIP metalloprotease RseP [Gemmatimonadales bacterium]
MTLFNSLWPLIVTLGVLIFVHELGHFIAAKWAGIRVHRFALGMGNPIPGLSFQRGKTEYAICWLPLGGYVKMASREEGATSSALEGGEPPAGPAVAPPVAPDEYFEAKPVWKRMIVILAGVTMNVVFAWLVYSGLRYHYGEPLNPVTTVGRVASDSLPPSVAPITGLHPGDRIQAIGGQPVSTWEEVVEGILTVPGDSVVIEVADGRRIVLPIHRSALTERATAAYSITYAAPAVFGEVVPGYPAAAAGLTVGDTVLRVNGDSINDWWALFDRIRESPDREMTLLVAGTSGRREVRLTPRSEQEKQPDGSMLTVGKLGVRAAEPIIHRTLTFGQSLVIGWRDTRAASTKIVRTVQGLLSARISSREVGGPIMIGQVAAQTARLGVEFFLSFMGLVSVNLAILNLLPIPILDGGQFLFLLAEAVRRRPLSYRLRERLTLVGLVLIVMLMVLAFRNDIARNWDVITRFFGRAVGQ